MTDLLLTDTTLTVPTDLTLSSDGEGKSTDFTLSANDEGIKHHILSTDCGLSDFDYDLDFNDKDEQSVKDFLMKRLYEKLEPLKKDIAAMKISNCAKDKELRSSIQEKKILKEQLAHEQEARAILQKKCETLLENIQMTDLYLKEVKLRLEKTENIETEYQTLLNKNEEKTKYCDAIKEQLEQAQKEIQLTNNELQTCRHEINFLCSDKNFLSQQLDEFRCRCTELEEKLISVQCDLEKERESHKEVLDTLTKTRTEKQTEYECHVQEELARIRMNTQLQLDEFKAVQLNKYDTIVSELKQQTKFIDEERLQLQIELRQAEQQLREAALKLDEEQMQSKKYIHELELTIKNKEHELDRLRTTRQHHAATISELHEQNDSLLQTVEFLKKELEEFRVCNLNKLNDNVRLHGEQLEEALRRLRSSDYPTYNSELRDTVQKQQNVIQQLISKNTDSEASKYSIFQEVINRLEDDRNQLEKENTTLRNGENLNIKLFLTDNFKDIVLLTSNQQAIVGMKEELMLALEKIRSDYKNDNISLERCPNTLETFWGSTKLKHLEPISSSDSQNISDKTNLKNTLRLTKVHKGVKPPKSKSSSSSARTNFKECNYLYHDPCKPQIL